MYLNNCVTDERNMVGENLDVLVYMYFANKKMEWFISECLVK